MKSRAKGGFTPGGRRASALVIKRAMLPTAHSQLSPTIVSATPRVRGSIWPASAISACKAPPEGRMVSGALSVTSVVSPIIPAISRNTVGQLIRAASISASAPPTIDAVR